MRLERKDCLSVLDGSHDARIDWISMKSLESSWRGRIAWIMGILSHSSGEPVMNAETLCPFTSFAAATAISRSVAGVCYIGSQDERGSSSRMAIEVILGLSGLRHSITEIPVLLINMSLLGLCRLGELIERRDDQRDNST